MVFSIIQPTPEDVSKFDRNFVFELPKGVQRRGAHSTILHRDETDTEEDLRIARADQHYAMQVGAIIDQHYKGCLFIVEVDSPQGIVRVKHPLLPATWGYTLFTDQMQTDPSGKLIVKACGELLERFHLPRGRYRRDMWDEARRRYAQTARGVFPLTYNPRTGRLKREIPVELRR